MEIWMPGFQLERGGLSDGSGIQVQIEHERTV